MSEDEPAFEQQWYETWIPENLALQSTVLALQAYSRNPILYSIEDGNENDMFGMDCQAGKSLGHLPNYKKSFRVPNFEVEKSAQVQLSFYLFLQALYT